MKTSGTTASLVEALILTSFRTKTSRIFTECGLALTRMVIFHKKCPSSRLIKVRNLPFNSIISFRVLASTWTILKTGKIEFAISWEMKSVPGHLKFLGKLWTILLLLAFLKHLLHYFIAHWRSPWEGEMSLSKLPIFPYLSDVLKQVFSSFEPSLFYP